ncbi:MAG: hypothetical protein ACK50S_00970 [bacterium]
MTASRLRNADRMPPTRTASWAARVVLALLATVAAIAAFVAQPPAPHASHATDGEVLAWVESHDAFDASAGLVDAAVAERPSAPVAHAWASVRAAANSGLADAPPPLVGTGTCRALLLTGLPAADTIGCELPKSAGDPTEVEPPRVVGGPAPLPKRDTIVVESDPIPLQAQLQRPLRPPSA